MVNCNEIFTKMFCVHICFMLNILYKKDAFLSLFTNYIYEWVFNSYEIWHIVFSCMCAWVCEKRDGGAGESRILDNKYI